MADLSGSPAASTADGTSVSGEVMPACTACSALVVSAPVRFSASRLVNSVPKTATPRVAPTSRK